jgi:hypothetical protein
MLMINHVFSDDALDEPLHDASTQMPQPSRHRQQSQPSLPPGGPYQPGWHQFRPKYEAARNDSAGMTGILAFLRTNCGACFET